MYLLFFLSGDFLVTLTEAQETHKITRSREQLVNLVAVELVDDIIESRVKIIQHIYYLETDVSQKIRGYEFEVNK